MTNKISNELKDKINKYRKKVKNLKCNDIIYSIYNQYGEFEPHKYSITDILEPKHGLKRFDLVQYNMKGKKINDLLLPVCGRPEEHYLFSYDETEMVFYLNWDELMGNVLDTYLTSKQSWFKRLLHKIYEPKRLRKMKEFLINNKNEYE